MELAVAFVRDILHRQFTENSLASLSAAIRVYTKEARIGRGVRDRSESDRLVHGRSWACTRHRGEVAARRVTLPVMRQRQSGCRRRCSERAFEMRGVGIAYRGYMTWYRQARSVGTADVTLEPVWGAPCVLLSD